MVQVDHRWYTWNFKWSTESSINLEIEHAVEFTDLCAKQYRLVVHEVSAQQSGPTSIFLKRCSMGQKGGNPLPWINEWNTSRYFADCRSCFTYGFCCFTVAAVSSGAKSWTSLSWMLLFFLSVETDIPYQINFLAWPEYGAGRFVTFLAAQGALFFLILFLSEFHYFAILGRAVSRLYRLVFKRKILTVSLLGEAGRVWLRCVG